jgi:CHAD domain-containing protein
VIELDGRTSTRKRTRRAVARAASDRSAQLAVGGAAIAGAAIAAGKAIAARGADGSRTGGEPSRAYRLKRKEPAAGGIRRIAVGRATSALEHLRMEAGDADTAEAVHEARKDLKKLRAVLRLVRDELGPEVYRRENDRFRDAGRELAGARDAEVKLATLDTLAERFDDDFPRAEVEPLVDVLTEERETLIRRLEADGKPGGPRALAAERVSSGRAAIADWPLGSGGLALVEPGLKRTYRRGRRRFADVREDASAENVHEWRKRVKDLWYHLRLLRNAWPEVVGTTSDEAHELADLLGDHHDLAVLAEDIAGRELSKSGGISTLPRLIARRQSELLDDALELGRRIYAEKPRAFTKRLGAYWAAWR